jgi:drug/metabolite transporter (DMT)-like permease
MSIGIIMAKPIIEEMALVWSTTIRLAGGTLALALFALFGKGWRKNWTVFTPSPIWKFALPASVLGTYMALLFWIGGFKYTYAAVAAVLNQTSVVFAIILAVIFLREPIGGRKLVAFGLAVTGVVVVTFAERLTAVAGLGAAAGDSADAVVAARSDGETARTARGGALRALRLSAAGVGRAALSRMRHAFLARGAGCDGASVAAVSVAGGPGGCKETQVRT